MPKEYLNIDQLGKLPLEAGGIDQFCTVVHIWNRVINNPGQIKNIETASEGLSVSPDTAAKHLSDFEKKFLGGSQGSGSRQQLIRRTTGKGAWVENPEYRHVIECVEQVLISCQELVRRFTGPARIDAIRVGCEDFMLRPVISRVLMSMRRESASLGESVEEFSIEGGDVEIVVGTPDELIALYDGEKIDMVFTTQFRTSDNSKSLPPDPEPYQPQSIAALRRCMLCPRGNRMIKDVADDRRNGTPDDEDRFDFKLLNGVRVIICGSPQSRDSLMADVLEKIPKSANIRLERNLFRATSISLGENAVTFAHPSLVSDFDLREVEVIESKDFGTTHIYGVARNTKASKSRGSAINTIFEKIQNEFSRIERHEDTQVKPANRRIRKRIESFKHVYHLSDIGANAMAVNAEWIDGTISLREVSGNVHGTHTFTIPKGFRGAKGSKSAHFLLEGKMQEQSTKEWKLEYSARGFSAHDEWYSAEFITNGVAENGKPHVGYWFGTGTWDHRIETFTDQSGIDRAETEGHLHAMVGFIILSDEPLTRERLGELILPHRTPLKSRVLLKVGIQDDLMPGEDLVTWMREARSSQRRKLDDIRRQLLKLGIARIDGKQESSNDQDIARLIQMIDDQVREIGDLSSWLLRKEYLASSPDEISDVLTRFMDSMGPVPVDSIPGWQEHRK